MMVSDKKVFPINTEGGTILLLDTIYFLDGSKIHFYSSAVVRCIGLLQWRYVLLIPFLWMVPLPLRDILYRVVARYRRKIFGQNVSCTFTDLNEARNKEV